MEFASLLDSLRAQSEGNITEAQYAEQLAEEKELLLEEIEKAFANKTYHFDWMGGMSLTHVRALKQADCRLVTIFVEGNYEFAGWRIYVNEKYLLQ